MYCVKSYRKKVDKTPFLTRRYFRVSVYTQITDTYGKDPSFCNIFHFLFNLCAPITNLRLFIVSCYGKKRKNEKKRYACK